MPSNVHPLPNPNYPSTATPKTGRRRTRYGKPSNTIRSKQAKPYEDALAYAIEHETQLGLAFVFVSVTWGGTSYAGAPHYSPIIIAKLEAFRKWFQRHDSEAFHAFWVREIGDTKGEHWHLLVHCPKHLRLGKGGFYAYAKCIIPKRVLGAVTTTDKKYDEPCPGCGEPRDWKHLARCYFLKGSTDIVRERNSIDKCASALPEIYSQDQGIILGKRLGYPRAFAQTARQRDGTTSGSKPDPTSNFT